MVSRRCIALSAVMSFFLPAVAHAGAGGTPTALGAGKSTEYCCQVWERVTPPRHGTDDRQASDKSAPSFVNGTGCNAIDEDVFSRQACAGTVAKCRGEFFTPATGKVERCLTP